MIRKAENAAVNRINKPFNRFFNRNCPSPGIKREETRTPVELIEGFDVLAEVVMRAL